MSKEEKKKTVPEAEKTAPVSEEQEKKPCEEPSSTEVKKAADECSAPAAEAADESAPETDGQDERDTALQQAQADLSAARTELAAAKDRYLRLAAEYDNYKKRTAREKEELYAVSVQSVVTGLLPVLDALDAAKLPEGEKEAEGLLKMKKLLDAQLEKLGVTAMEAQGQLFDPAFHNAVMHVEDESLGENTVAEVFQKGYLYKNRVVRVAMVKVAN